MPSLSTNVTFLKRDGNTASRTCWYVLQVLPVTLTVVLGPFISFAFHLTWPVDAAQGSFSVAQATRGLLCIFMFFSIFLSKDLNLLKHRLIRPLLFLAVYAVLTSLASPYRYMHIVFAVRLIFIVLVFACTFRLAKERICTERWLKMCAWVILLVMAISIGAGLATGEIVAGYKSRFATAGFTHINSVAASLVLSSLPVFMSLIPNSISGMAATVVLFTSLFFTMRRTSLIAGVVATCSSVLIYLISCWRRILWRRVLVLIGIFILLAGVGLSTSAGDDLIERFSDLNPFSGGTGSHRYIFWRVSLEYIMHRPMHVQLLGEGMGSLNDVIKQSGGRWICAHNDWLNFAGAFGLCGLTGISWWFFELARLTWSFRCRQGGLFQGACAALVMLGLVSIGGGFFNPAWALTYATLGFWAGHVTSEDQQHHTRPVTITEQISNHELT